jgi:hypothetical protein
MSFKEKIKENWLKEDKICPTCNQIVKKQRGITRQNIKKLIRLKFNLNEIIFMFIIFMVLVIAFLYFQETRTCREWIKEQQPMFNGTLQSCQIFCSDKCILIHSQDKKTSLPNFNLTNFTIK